MKNNSHIPAQLGGPVATFDDAPPNVAGGVLRIVTVALIFSILGLALGWVAGAGFWGLVLSWFLGGHAGVAAMLAVIALFD